MIWGSTPEKEGENQGVFFSSALTPILGGEAEQRREEKEIKLGGLEDDPAAD